MGEKGDVNNILEFLLADKDVAVLQIRIQKGLEFVKLKKDDDRFFIREFRAENGKAIIKHVNHWGKAMM